MPLSNTQSSIISCAAAPCDAGTKCPASYTATCTSAPCLCTYPASRLPPPPPLLLRHTARGALRNAASPSHSSSLTHASAATAPSTRVPGDRSSASTSLFALFITSSWNASSTAWLSSCHGAPPSARRRAPSAALTPASLKTSAAPAATASRDDAAAPSASYSDGSPPRQDPRARVRRLAPPRRACQRHRLPLHRLGLAPLRVADEPHAVGDLRVRGDLRHGVDEAVADGHPAEVDPPPPRQARVRGEDERAGRGDRLAAVALAGEEERPRAELR
nr:unnamed protein product [Digitaria exilis]